MAKDGDTETRECEVCGEVVECTYGPDPFAYDIHGDDTPVWECDQCRYESGRDI